MSGVNCPDCNERFSRGCDPYDVRFIETKGACRKCFQLSKGLIKDGTDTPYYVPWWYRNSIDSELPTDSKYFEDANMSIPKISWCDRHKKWKLTTSGADAGGYDVQDFEIYFDTKEEIFELMLKEEE
jgi:hypothetical protein